MVLYTGFEKEENTYRIYEAFRDWAGVKPVFRTDQPSVEVSALNAQHRGYAVLVNHSAQVQNLTVFTTLPIHALSLVTPQGPRPLTTNGSTWKMELAPYEGAVVEWK